MFPIPVWMSSCRNEDLSIELSGVLPKQFKPCWIQVAFYKRLLTKQRCIWHLQWLYNVKWLLMRRYELCWLFIISLWIVWSTMIDPSMLNLWLQFYLFLNLKLCDIRWDFMIKEIQLSLIKFLKEHKYWKLHWLLRLKFAEIGFNIQFFLVLTSAIKCDDFFFQERILMVRHHRRMIIQEF